MDRTELQDDISLLREERDGLQEEVDELTKRLAILEAKVSNAEEYRDTLLGSLQSALVALED